MHRPSPPTLERAADGLALLAMLVLLAISLNTPTNAPPPSIIVATPAPTAVPPADPIRGKE